MKLSAWAKSQGISYLTAYRMWKKGTLPVPAYQIQQGTKGTIIVDLEGTGPRGVKDTPPRSSPADREERGTSNLDLALCAGHRALLERAAALQRLSLSEFVLQQAVSAARRRVIEEFLVRLDAPAQQRLQQLLNGQPCEDSIVDAIMQRCLKRNGA